MELSQYKLEQSDGIFTFKNKNTTIGFVRFNVFRKRGLATKLLKLVKQQTGKEIILQKPISPLGSKLVKSLNKWK